MPTIHAHNKESEHPMEPVAARSAGEPSPASPQSNLYQITPTIRVVDTDRQWVIQTAITKRTRRGTKPTGEWIDRAYITSRSMLNRELKRLVGNGAPQTGLVGHVDPEVLHWLNKLPARHISSGTVPALSVIETLEAMGTNHTAYDLRDDLPLVVIHGPLRFRDKWNARYDV